MILKLISLLNFKNYKNLKIEFSNHVNCFLGNNGVGKTNLLDAIYYLSFCKSYYNVFESDNIRYGENFFMINGQFLNDDGGEFKIGCSLKDKKKKVQLNNKRYNKLSEHIGKIPLVIVTPLDSALILGGGEVRRKFINILLSQIDNEYLQDLISYNRTLKQRNALLKKFDSTSFNNDLLLTYNQVLSELGNNIFLKRKLCVSLIIDKIQYYYDFISEKNETVDVEYHSQLMNSSLDEILEKNIEKDKILMFTSSGTHRDDFLFKINTHSLKKSGSQGQQKTFLIALKFAYFDLLKSKLKVNPILLLDDIFDKLDHNRVEQIVRILNQNRFGQIFITDTSFDRIDSIMQKVNNKCRYFMFDKNGLYEEKLKN